MSLISSNPAIASKIDELWNKFWSGGISNPLTAIEQISYLLFMKKLDDKDQENIANAEFTGEHYDSIFEGIYVLPYDRLKSDATKEEIKLNEKEKGIDKHRLRWSQIKRIAPVTNMLPFVQQYAFPFIKELDGKDSPFSRHMANAVFMIPKATLLSEAILAIDYIYEEIEKDSAEKGQDFQDIQGDVYEMLLSEIASAGKNGQFRTPRHIIKLLVELVNPQLGHKIADPACGTGGFLLGAYQYMITHLNKNEAKKEPDEDGFVLNSKSASLTQDIKNILGQSIQGFDIDQTMVRLGLMNLMMHGIDSPQIDYKDTLSKSYIETSEYDVVLANPPFTGNIDKGDINEELKINTTKSELLFIERIYNMLKMGGTAGIIVPQGVLFSTSNAFIDARKLMIKDSELKAVVTLPSGVFKPYAGVSTAILIFTKGGQSENIWFYDLESDGYSLDDKRNKLDDYGDLQDVIKHYKLRNEEDVNDRQAKFFSVPVKEIIENKYDLSFTRYQEKVYEELEYESPQIIIDKLLGTEEVEGLEQQIIKGLKELKKILN